MNIKEVTTEPICLTYGAGGETCGMYYNCCSCGGPEYNGGACGCSYCFDCNACEVCKED